MRLNRPNFLVAEVGVVLHLTCRQELQSYYERFGFQHLARTEYPRYFRRMVPLVNLAMRFLGTQIIVMRREAA